MLRLYNTLEREKVDFCPIDDAIIKLYVCGPTVYNFPHVGNARSAIVYDVLYRILLFLYKKVEYVRNITDVDDKIVLAAEKEQKSITDITGYYAKVFQENMEVLGCIRPTLEPKATNHIKDIINMISILLDKKHAYLIKQSVYFNISSYESYGKLSGKKINDLISGSRVKIDFNKHNPGDFILWKPSVKHGWDSPWGYGRPGWHIECSAMSHRYLGSEFDIHGGGSDLQFPHHENEIAQSCSAYPGSKFARYWVHNGFVLLDKEKMSKSLGNVLTVNDLFERKIEGVVIRYALLSTHYRKPLNWTEDLLEKSTNIMNKFISIVQDYTEECEHSTPSPDIIDALCDDLNTPQAIAILHQYARNITQGRKELFPEFIGSLKFLGLFKKNINKTRDKSAIQKLIDDRNIAKNKKNFIQADKIRKHLFSIGIDLFDGKNGITTWKQTLKS